MLYLLTRKKIKLILTTIDQLVSFQHYVNVCLVKRSSLKLSMWFTSGTQYKTAYASLFKFIGQIGNKGLGSIILIAPTQM